MNVFFCLATDISRLVNKKWWRYITMWISPSFWVIISFRLDSAFYALFGGAYPAIRLFFWPLFLLFNWLGGTHDISYAAKIGPGLKILHPNLGIVISRYARIGDNFICTGGNCVGAKGKMALGAFVIIGDEVVMGVNSVVLGPLTIGNRCKIGAGAVVTKSFSHDQTIVGVPAAASKSSAATPIF